MAHADTPRIAVIADFDYDDTSGEVQDQSAAHAEMMHRFVDTLGQRFADQTGYVAKPLPCDRDRCTAGDMNQDILIARARQAGARLLVFGGIHKMSTLVQWGHVYMLDLVDEKLLIERSFTFRGDNDKAFQMAGEFVAGVLAAANPDSSAGARPTHTSAQ